MNNYIPVFEKFVNDNDLFYFDRINEAELPIPEQAFKLKSNGRTNPKGLAEYYNKSEAAIKDKPYYAPGDMPGGKWSPSSFGKSVIASLEGLVIGEQKTGHQATGFGINLDVHRSWAKLIEGESKSDPKAITAAFEQMDTYLDKFLITQFNSWISDNNYVFNQNMADALFSFAYNTGAGKLKPLTEGTSKPIGPRHESILMDGMMLYTKSGGSDNAGLVKRRNVEVALYLGLLSNENTFWGYKDNNWYDYDKKIMIRRTGGNNVDTVKPNVKTPEEITNASNTPTPVTTGK